MYGVLYYYGCMQVRMCYMYSVGNHCTVVYAATNYPTSLLKKKHEKGRKMPRQRAVCFWLWRGSNTYRKLQGKQDEKKTSMIRWHDTSRMSPLALALFCGDGFTS